MKPLRVGSLFLALFSSSLFGQIVTGKVTNATLNHQPLSQVPVVLQIFEKEKPAGSLEARTDAQGRFQFRGVPDKPQTHVLAEVLYQGIKYQSESSHYDAKQPETKLDVAVYEKTESDADIQVLMEHAIVDFRENQLWISNLLVVQNQGTHTFVGAQKLPDGKRETLRIGLPVGHSNLQLASGFMECCTVQEPTALVNTMEIKPGMQHFTYAYQLAPRPSLDIEKKFFSPTRAYAILTPESQGIRVTGSGLQPRESIENEGQKFRVYATGNLKPQAQLALRLELPGAKRDPQLSWILVATVVAVALGGVTFLALKGRRRSPGAIGKQPETPGEDWETERTALVEEIADLDQRYEAGEIQEAEYRRIRADKKSHLLKLASRLPR
ncbi:MAG: hypothetical protein HY652_01565 [Acidobacteria bacterium]|nr:hypothetical protein [Acidobacteriota bacterium]